MTKLSRPVLLAALFVVLNLIDAIMTAWAISVGGGEVVEVNPLMATLLRAGPATFIVVKVVAAALLAWYLVKRHPRSIVLWLGPLLVGLVLAWNVWRLTCC